MVDESREMVTDRFGECWLEQLLGYLPYQSRHHQKHLDSQVQKNPKIQCLDYQTQIAAEVCLMSTARYRRREGLGSRINRFRCHMERHHS